LPCWPDGWRCSPSSWCSPRHSGGAEAAGSIHRYGDRSYPCHAAARAACRKRINPKMQKISPRGLAEIAAHEGIVASPYRDSAGHWTVGIGHSAAAGWPAPATERRPVTLDEIVSIFLGDIARFEERVRRAFTRPLDQAQFDAAVSFDFNTGAIDRAAWVRLFNGGQELAARDAMLNWRRPPEVLRRRRRE